MQKLAKTDHAIHDLLKERWSPRAYSDRPIEPTKLLSLFEAARWSASGGNAQPWSFVVVKKENAELHQKLVGLTMGFNAVWTKDVPVLILAVAKENPDRPDAMRFTYYDVGQAVANLSIEATAQNLHVHQMAGFDAVKAKELLEVPDGYTVLTLIAIGYFGDINQLSEELRVRENAERSRKPLSEFVFNERWNNPLLLPEN